MATVWFEGIDDLNTIAVTLERKAARVGQEAATVVRRGAHQIEALGKQFVLVDTGATRGSISSDFIGDGRFGAFESQTGPTTSYAPFIEWGTERMAPAAFMGPAADIVGPEFVAAMAAISNPMDAP